MIVKNNIGLIGDTLGMFPFLIDLAKKHQGIILILEGSAFGLKNLFELIPKKYNIKIVDENFQLPENEQVINLNLVRAFNFSVKNKIHMTQSYYEQACLPTPPTPLKPELDIPFVSVPQYDYALAPFSRSLPEYQKWQQDKWNKLVDSMPDKKFVVFGDDRHDPKDFIFIKDNVEHMYGKSLIEVMNVMKKCRNGVISVITGISHIAYAIDVKCYLFNNQPMAWGNNFDAIQMKKRIPDITPEEVLQVLQNY